MFEGSEIKIKDLLFMITLNMIVSSKLAKFVFSACVIDSQHLSKKTRYLFSHQPTHVVISFQKMQMEVFISVICQVTNYIESQSLKTCLHTSILGELRTQLLGKTMRIL